MLLIIVSVTLLLWCALLYMDLFLSSIFSAIFLCQQHSSCNTGKFNLSNLKIFGFAAYQAISLLFVGASIAIYYISNVNKMTLVKKNYYNKIKQHRSTLTLDLSSVEKDKIPRGANLF